MVVPLSAEVDAHVSVSSCASANDVLAQCESETRIRSLLPGEGCLVVFIGETDVTALCVKDDSGLTYTPGTIPMLPGETSMIVYLVSAEDKWREIARTPFLVEVLKQNVPATKGTRKGKGEQPPATVAPVETPTVKNEGPIRFSLSRVCWRISRWLEAQQFQHPRR